VRRIAIMALTRKMLVDLYRYATHGIIPPSAVVNPHHSNPRIGSRLVRRIRAGSDRHESLAERGRQTGAF
jgi:hypothetical protein